MIGRPAGGLAQSTHTEAPDMPAALDAIDLQLAADGPEVVLPRDAAALVACALHDLPDLLARAWDEGHAAAAGLKLGVRLVERARIVEDAFAAIVGEVSEGLPDGVKVRYGQG